MLHGGFMGTTRKIKALKKGAEYGAAGASGTSLVFNVLGTCITVSNPVILAIASFVGAIFCCVGTCINLQEPDADEVVRENNLELKEIKRELGEVKDDLHHHYYGDSLNLHLFAAEHKQVDDDAGPELSLMDEPLIPEHKEGALRRSASFRL
jgi:hypothetical protein